MKCVPVFNCQTKTCCNMLYFFRIKITTTTTNNFFEITRQIWLETSVLATKIPLCSDCWLSCLIVSKHLSHFLNAFALLEGVGGARTVFGANTWRTARKMVSLIKCSGHPTFLSCSKYKLFFSLETFHFIFSLESLNILRNDICPLAYFTLGRGC